MTENADPGSNNIELDESDDKALEEAWVFITERLQNSRRRVRNEKKNNKRRQIQANRRSQVVLSG
jgi:hypothetical protein